ncbi:hypothetical protein Tco_1490445 [Tanacetum coccineum]
MKKTSHLGNPLFSDWTELYDKESRAMIQSLERKKDWKARMKGSFLLTQETQLAHPVPLVFSINRLGFSFVKAIKLVKNDGVELLDDKPVMDGLMGLDSAY